MPASFIVIKKIAPFTTNNNNSPQREFGPKINNYLLATTLYEQEGKSFTPREINFKLLLNEQNVFASLERIEESFSGYSAAATKLSRTKSSYRQSTRNPNWHSHRCYAAAAELEKLTDKTLLEEKDIIDDVEPSPSLWPRKKATAPKVTRDSITQQPHTLTTPEIVEMVLTENSPSNNKSISAILFPASLNTLSQSWHEALGSLAVTTIANLEFAIYQKLSSQPDLLLTQQEKTQRALTLIKNQNDANKKILEENIQSALKKLMLLSAKNVSDLNALELNLANNLLDAINANLNFIVYEPTNTTKLFSAIDGIQQLKNNANILSDLIGCVEQPDIFSQKMETLSEILGSIADALKPALQESHARKITFANINLAEKSQLKLIRTTIESLLLNFENQIKTNEAFATPATSLKTALLQLETKFEINHQASPTKESRIWGVPALTLSQLALYETLKTQLELQIEILKTSDVIVAEEIAPLLNALEQFDKVVGLNKPSKQMGNNHNNLLALTSSRRESTESNALQSTQTTTTYVSKFN